MDSILGSEKLIGFGAAGVQQCTERLEDRVSDDRKRAGKLSKKLHNRQMPRINNGVKAEWPQKIGYNVRLLS